MFIVFCLYMYHNLPVINFITKSRIIPVGCEGPYFFNDFFSCMVFAMNILSWNLHGLSMNLSSGLLLVYLFLRYVKSL